MSRERQLSQCEGKFKHRTIEAARRACRGISPDPYLCPYCHYWHIGHKKPKTEAMVQFRRRKEELGTERGE